MADEYYYPWYPAHYRRDAGHLDHLSDSCYRRLLDAYMEGGEPLRKDPIRLMAIMRVSAEQFALVWPHIEPFFQLSPDGYLHHKRCNIELDRQDATVRNKSIAGKRSAEKRRMQKEQYQLLINSRSTRVHEQPLGNKFPDTLLPHQKSIGYQQPFNTCSTDVPPIKGKRREEHHKNDGADAPVNLFNGPLEWLIRATGKTEQECRTLIGKFRKTAQDDGLVFNAIAAAKRAEAVEPISYITAALKPKPRKLPQI